MQTNYLIIIELGLVLGAVLAFGFWELYKLRRSRETDKKKDPLDHNEKENDRS